VLRCERHRLFWRQTILAMSKTSQATRSVRKDDLLVMSRYEEDEAGNIPANNRIGRAGIVSSPTKSLVKLNSPLLLRC
jgi:hypothetical protein